MPKKKSKLKWTKKLPTVDGFYWFRLSKEDDAPERMAVYGGIAANPDRCFSLMTKEPYYAGSQWYGPIPSKEPA